MRSPVALALMTASPTSPHPFADHLSARGACLKAGEVTGFQDAQAEHHALIAGTTLHPLLGEGIMRAHGADAASFLQGQLSNDLGLLNATNAQWTSYCSAQGRVLAIPLAWKAHDGILLWVPGEILDPLLARLRRYVLRARVQLDNVSSEYLVLGVGGPQAATALRELVPAPPAEPMARTTASDGNTVVMLAAELYVVIVPMPHAARTWDTLAAACVSASAAGWQWRLVQAGIPRLGVALQEQFVPQMLNLEQLGAISFDKGCYPGQEIVARAQYLGQVKRRLTALHAAEGPLSPGQPILRADGSSAGTVVAGVPAPQGGWDALAVVQTDALAHEPLHTAGASQPLTRRG
ncbi:MAG: folate-binding protein YgfZ [Burkholderiales bacterium]|nr:folate-binding protein YgfZ [Burkholderiales bacterium]